ncbi:Ester hydrolase C11orf54 [Fasciola gigantica]|uniref:Ester hydrolase C11orf54 n=1 Tax=Fasciola gigantica TaxID=46835 RepID=A0A504YLP8_FASGI|nr:Ester hydrolase C11orf54 [Fasciola gigantica]
MIFDLHCPKLDDIAYALQSHLKDCFSQARCCVVDCPDLTKPNFGLTKPGLGGSETLCDFGSFDYLLPTPDKNKRYDLLDAFKHTNVNSGCIFGAAAGPHFISGVASELTVNLSCEKDKASENSSLCGSFDCKHQGPLATLSKNTNFAMLGQMFLCEGTQGKVLELVCSSRTRPGKFDAMLREALTSAFGGRDLPVGLGGVIVQETGKCSFHVLPEFSSEKLDTPDKVKQWLKFFEMDAPVISVGTVISHDPVSACVISQ